MPAEGLCYWLLGSYSLLFSHFLVVLPITGFKENPSVYITEPVLGGSQNLAITE